MEEYDRTLRYLFILALVLIAVAYWAGTTGVLGTVLSGINTLGLTFTGRDSKGQFAAYPGNAPSVSA